MDVDRYLPPKLKKQAPKGKAKPSKKSGLGVLRVLALNGKIQAGKLKVQGLHLQNVKVTISGKKGLLQIAPLSLNLYQGLVSGRIALDSRHAAPKSDIQLQVKGVQVASLLQDLQAGAKPAGSTAKAAMPMDLNLKGQIVDPMGAPASTWMFSPLPSHHASCLPL